MLDGLELGVEEKYQKAMEKFREEGDRIYLIDAYNFLKKSVPPLGLADKIKWAGSMIHCQRNILEALVSQEESYSKQVPQDFKDYFEKVFSKNPSEVKKMLDSTIVQMRKNNYKEAMDILKELKISDNPDIYETDFPKELLILTDLITNYQKITEYMKEEIDELEEELKDSLILKRNDSFDDLDEYAEMKKAIERNFY